MIASLKHFLLFAAIVIAHPAPFSSAQSDDFSGDGPLLSYTTNNPTALPQVERVGGRYRANLTDNTGNITLHFNNDQGRLDAKLVSFPFVHIARNIGIGTQADSQIAPPHSGDPYNFCGIQVHSTDLNARNSSHVVIGHRGGARNTIEGKNTLNGDSSVNDDGYDALPLGRGDIKIEGAADRTLTVSWQQPNLTGDAANDNFQLYRGSGALPGQAPNYGPQVYIGLITYAYANQGVPFVGTCDAIEFTQGRNISSPILKYGFTHGANTQRFSILLAEPDITYTLQSSSDFSIWQDLGSFHSGSETANALLSEQAMPTQKAYYRVLANSGE